MPGRFSRSPIRPIQIGRMLIRAMDSGRSAGADGRLTAPNIFTVQLHENDRAALSDLEKPLIAELIDAAAQYARDEGLSLIGDVVVTVTTDASLKPGKCVVQAAMKASFAMTGGLSENSPSSLGEAERSLQVSTAPVAPPAVAIPTPVPPPMTPPTVATPSIPPVPASAAIPPAPEKKAILVFGDGTKVALKLGVLSIGRSAESSVPLNDTNVSRRHAEIRSRGDGARAEWFVIDLGSTNGTVLNGVKISGEQRLKNGDSLMFGGTSARFEVS